MVDPAPLDRHPVAPPEEEATSGEWDPTVRPTSKWHYGPFGTGFMVAMGALSATLIFSAIFWLVIVLLLALGHSSNPLQRTSMLLPSRPAAAVVSASPSPYPSPSPTASPTPSPSPIGLPTPTPVAIPTFSFTIGVLTAPDPPVVPHLWQTCRDRGLPFPC